MPKEHLLLGLEPDNLLAFLALLGFHRCLDHARPDWHPRVYWGGVPLRPFVVFSSDVERRELLEAAAQEAAHLSEAHSFDRTNVDFTKEEARNVLRASVDDRTRADLLSSLMSDAAVGDDKVRVTPFCAMFGQGHQNFLERLEGVPKGIPPKELQDEITPDVLNSAEKLEEALFRPWERSDRTQSFRWDPLEDRRYALRFENPSGDKGLTVHAANRLACLALPLLTAVPVRERGEIRLYALTTKWCQGALVVQWPVWSPPASLRAVVMMLAGCGLHQQLAGLGVNEVYTSERISVGKFFNFTRAAPSNG